MHGTGSFKTLLKKPNLDLNVLANFRPVSNLPFISKILEKTVLQQLQSFLDKNKVFELFQSGFKKYHSTETALLKVLNDVVISADSGDCTALVLLDLSAAFHIVDHAILLARLEHCVGIKGAALEGFTLDRIFQIGSSVLILGNIRRRLLFYHVVFHRDLF